MLIAESYDSGIFINIESTGIIPKFIIMQMTP